MTPLEIIYGIREKLKEYVDDTRFTDDYLLHLVSNKRSTYIRNYYNRFQRPVDEQIMQTIIIPLEEVDASELDTVEQALETIMRSSVRLPDFIELDHKIMLERVTTIGVLDVPHINLVSKRRFPYSGSGEYDGDQIFVTLDDNGYLLLKSNNNEEFTLENLAVIGVLQDPLQELDYNSKNSNDTLNTFNYPLNKTMTESIVNEIVSDLAQIKVLPSDEENNSADDATIIPTNARIKNRK